jgi:1-deoxy-D-xylulose-5-phosphate reductoisomerase
LKRVTILGATGSIGQNTIDLIKRAPDDHDVVALTGGRNVALLAQDAIDLNAQIAVTCYDDCAGELRDLLSHTDIETASGEAAIIEAASHPCDWTMSAIVGAAGLKPGIAALAHGGILALANKESLVTAGPILLETAKTYGATVLPVDSEHSAVFQALVGEDINSVERIIITASGGAFRDWPIADLAKATVAEATSHPIWNMGQRITIDSASMFNKGMELIETKEFFGVSSSHIDAVLHPESTVHAMVAFHDGCLMAHMGAPDMRHAIGYALHWPKREALPLKRLDFTQDQSLTFRPIDVARYPAISLARTVMEEGGFAGTIYNAAKETALDGFIAGKIGFLDMARVVDMTLTKILADHSLQNAPFTLDTVFDTDHRARIEAAQALYSLG